MLDIRTGSHFRDAAQMDANGRQMTRREVIAGLGAVAIAGSANATVRHGLGARLAANFGGGGDAKLYPYEPDLAWWDGICNNGYGLPHADTHTWKDLCGTNDAILRSEIICESDGYTNVGGIQQAWMDGLLIAIDGIRTIECVFRVDVKSPSSVISLNSLNKKRYLYLNGNYNTVFGSNGHSFKYNLTAPEKVSYVLTYDDDVNEAGEFYANGISISKNSSIDSWNPRLCIGSYAINGAAYCYSLQGKIFAIRVHSTKLTQEQIADNYSVDKIRFNLT